MLSVEDGEVVAAARVRGKPKALAEFERRFVAATTDGPGLRVAIAHADADDEKANEGAGGRELTFIEATSEARAAVRAYVRARLSLPK